MRDILEARQTDPAIVEEVDRYLGTYVPAYRDGFLLVSGGIANQPARYLAMIGAILALDAAAEVKRLELLKSGEE